MKILVCGGREYNEKAHFEKFMDQQHHVYGFTHIIHGGAPGADTLADTWARSRGVQTVACHANWTKQGKAAGPIRNRRMAELLPDMVLAFPGGAGTANMIKTAEERGIHVLRLEGSQLSESGES